MYGELMQNVDAGARVVASSVDLSETGEHAYVTCAAFSGNGNLGVVGLGNGSLKRLSPLAGAKGLQSCGALDATPLAAVGDIDGESVLVGTDDGRLVRCRPDGSLETLAEERPHWIEQVAAHPKSGLRAYSVGRTAVLLDERGHTLSRLDDHPSTVAGLAFSPNATWLAAAHYGGVTSWRSAAGGTSCQRLEWHGSHTAVAWSPGGSFIVTAMQDKELHCWKMPERKSMRMSGYPSKIRSLSFTADGSYIAASGADTVTVWSCAGRGPAGRPPREFGYVYNGIVAQVAAHPKVNLVAGGYNDGTVLIGRIETENAVIARPGTGAPVTTLAWSPEGGTLVAGTDSGELAVMRVAVSEI